MTKSIRVRLEYVPSGNAILDQKYSNCTDDQINEIKKSIDSLFKLTTDSVTFNISGRTKCGKSYTTIPKEVINNCVVYVEEDEDK